MLKMFELDHRLVVVGGLIVACLFYQVPLYTILVVVISGCVVYLRNKYKRGWRVSLGLSGLQFTRQTRGTRLRNAASASQRSLSSLTTPKLNKNAISSLAIGPWSTNASLKISPVLQVDYSNYNCRQNVRSRFPPFASATMASGAATCQSAEGMYSPKTQPVKLGVQTPGSAESGMELSLNKSDTTYDAICQEKYVGVGIYPLVNLDPLQLGLLSHVNSSMTRNRVTVKVAPPEKTVTLKRRVDFSHSSLSEDSFCKTRDVVIDALKNERKRLIRNDTSEINSTHKRQKTESESVAASVPVQYSSPSQHTISNGILPQFDNTLRSELTHVSPSCFEHVRETVKDSFKKPSPIVRAQTNAIYSSYSSSQKLFEKMHMNLGGMKRKSQMEPTDVPEAKVTKNDGKSSEEEELQQSPSVKILNRSKDSTAASSPVCATEKGTFLQANIQESSVLREKRAHHADAVATTNQSLAKVYIPSHIPTLKDYLEDQKMNRQRLQKLLCSLAGFEDKKEETKELQDRVSDVNMVGKVAAAAGCPLPNVNQFGQLATPTTSSPTTTSAFMPFSFGASPISTLASSDQQSVSVSTTLLGSKISNPCGSTTLNQEHLAVGSVEFSDSEQLTVPSVSISPTPAVNFVAASTVAPAFPTSTAVIASPQTTCSMANAQVPSLPLNVAGGAFGSPSILAGSLQNVVSNSSSTPNPANLSVTSASTVASPMPPNPLSLAPITSPAPSQGFSLGINSSSLSPPASTSTVTSLSFPAVSSPSSGLNATTLVSMPSTQSAVVTTASMTSSPFMGVTVGLGFQANPLLQKSLSVLPPAKSSSTASPFGNLGASAPTTQAPNSASFQLENKNSSSVAAIVQPNVKPSALQNSAKFSFGYSTSTASPMNSNVTASTFSSPLSSGNISQEQKGIPSFSGFHGNPSFTFGSSPSISTSQTTTAPFGVTDSNTATGFNFGAGNVPKTSFPMSYLPQPLNVAGNGPVTNNVQAKSPFASESSSKQPPASGFSFGSKPTTSFTAVNSTTSITSAVTTAPNVFSGNFGTSTASSSMNSTFNSQSSHPSTNGLFQSSNTTGANNNFSASKPFVFGSPSTSSSQGFTFNPATKPTFNFVNSVSDSTSTPMFSIGSGSTSVRHGKTAASRLHSHR